MSGLKKRKMYGRSKGRATEADLTRDALSRFGKDCEKHRSHGYRRRLKPRKKP